PLDRPAVRYRSRYHFFIRARSRTPGKHFPDSTKNAEGDLCWNHGSGFHVDQLDQAAVFRRGRHHHLRYHEIRTRVSALDPNRSLAGGLVEPQGLRSVVLPVGLPVHFPDRIGTDISIRPAHTPLIRLLLNNLELPRVWHPKRRSTSVRLAKANQ